MRLAHLAQLRDDLRVHRDAEVHESIALGLWRSTALRPIHVAVFFAKIYTEPANGYEDAVNHPRDGTLEKHEGHARLRCARWRCSSSDDDLRAKERAGGQASRANYADDRAGTGMNRETTADEQLGMDWRNALTEE